MPLLCFVAFLLVVAVIVLSVLLVKKHGNHEDLKTKFDNYVEGYRDERRILEEEIRRQQDRADESAFADSPNASVKTERRVIEIPAADSGIPITLLQLNDHDRPLEETRRLITPDWLTSMYTAHALLRSVLTNVTGTYGDNEAFLRGTIQQMTGYVQQFVDHYNGFYSSEDPVMREVLSRKAQEAIGNVITAATYVTLSMSEENVVMLERSGIQQNATYFAREGNIKTILAQVGFDPEHTSIQFVKLDVNPRQALDNSNNPQQKETYVAAYRTSANGKVALLPLVPHLAQQYLANEQAIEAALLAELEGKGEADAPGLVIGDTAANDATIDEPMLPTVEGTDAADAALDRATEHALNTPAAETDLEELREAVVASADVVLGDEVAAFDGDRIGVDVAPVELAPAVETDGA